MSDSAAPPKTAGASTGAAPAQTTKPDIAATVQTLQFGWFVGHVVTVVATLFYALTYVRVWPGSYKFWYKLALVGVVESFGVLILQTVKKNGANAKQLVKEDNLQYLVLGVVLLFYSPYVLLTLSPFFLFSSFHVLSYSKHYLLPALNIGDNHPLSVKIGNFVALNNNKSIQLASLLEVYTLGWLFVRVLTFRQTSVVPFLVYLVFIKLRFEKSAFTRSAFKSLELKVEDVVAKTGQPAAKDVWVKIKGVLHQISSVHLLNDYTKEKAT